MTILFGVLTTVLAHQDGQQGNAMRIALITIAALAGANLLLVILMSSRKKKSQ